MLLKNGISILLPTVLSLLGSFFMDAYTPISAQNAGYALLFFMVLCFILNLVYARFASSENLTGLLITGIVIKLLLSLGIIVTYAFVNQPGLFNFSMHFILYYILFTIFEIRYLSALIKNNSSNSTTAP